MNWPRFVRAFATAYAAAWGLGFLGLAGSDGPWTGEALAVCVWMAWRPGQVA